MYKIECRAREEVMGRGSEHSMLLDQHVTKGSIIREVWTCNEVDYMGLRVFGCPTYAHIVGDERMKIDAKPKQFIFLRYHKGVKGFKMWDPKENKVVISRDMILDEKGMLQNT